MTHSAKKLTTALSRYLLIQNRIRHARSLMLLPRIILAMTMFVSSSVSFGFVIDFECLPPTPASGSGCVAPSDNAQIVGPYTDGTTSVAFGFDTNNDLVIDVPARFEKRGVQGGPVDPIISYVADNPVVQDIDLTTNNVGGDWLLRNPKTPEPDAVTLFSGDDMLIVYSGILPNAASAQVWDLDGLEQWRFEAFDSSDSPITFIDTIPGPGNSTGGQFDGRPYSISFNNLPTLIKTIRVSQIGGSPTAGFGFDNFNATAGIPEPSTLFLATLGLLGIGFHRRKRA